MLFDFLSYLYSITYCVNFTNEKRNRIRKLLNNIIARLCLSVTRMLRNTIDYPNSPLVEGNGVIVSLTSFPKRFPDLKYTLRTILRQSVRPEKIVVNLTVQECPNGFNDIPDYLKEFIELGVEYRFRPKNIKPHCKYFFIMQEYINTDKLIVTMDDDILYRSNVIESLLALHESNPDCICARIVRRISFKDGVPISYENWDIYNPYRKGHDLVAMGFGSVLYPVGLFRKSDLFNFERIYRLCLNADDLWLKANEVMLGVPVVTGAFETPDMALKSSSICNLSAENVQKSSNDIQWEAINAELDIYSRIILSLNR